MKTETDALLAAIHADPRDHVRKLVYADWLLDQGRDDEAECWRWMGEKGRCPSLRDDGAWLWWFHHHHADRSAIVPSSLYNVIRKHCPPIQANFDWPAWGGPQTTLARSLRGMVELWLRLTPEERAACWAWVPPEEKS